jgi:hypothetical protein
MSGRVAYSSAGNAPPLLHSSILYFTRHTALHKQSHQPSTITHHHHHHHHHHHRHLNSLHNNNALPAMHRHHLPPSALISIHGIKTSSFGAARHQAAPPLANCPSCFVSVQGSATRGNPSNPSPSSHVPCSRSSPPDSRLNAGV